MAGVGKLLKQAQKMQQQMESVKTKLAEEVMTVSKGGGAITVNINGMGEFLGFKLDPEFLKEDPELIEETLLDAVKEATLKAKETSETAMKQLTSGLSGLEGLGFGGGNVPGF